MKERLFSVSRAALDNLHYIGLVPVILLMVQAQLSTQITEKTLENSVEQQGVLRNVLWVNLLTQRATVLALSHHVTKDASSEEKALAVANSIPSFVRASASGNSPEESLLLEKVAAIQKLFKSAAKDRGFLEQIEKLGTELNREESREWYALLDKNKRLVEDLNGHHKEAYFTYALFIFYLGLLGWLSSRKKNAEKKLVNVEAALVSSAKMSALGEMAGGIAHEINSPLAIIGMTAEQAEELLQEGADQKTVIGMLHKIGETVRRISQIIQGLRTFARDDSSVPFIPVSVREIVQNTLSLCTETLKYADVQIRLEPIPASLSIQCRSVQISQVLLNLIGNACDAIQPLPKKWISIAAEIHGENVRILVTDSGARIPDKIRDKIFQPFFTTKEVGKGTGLGLSISKGIVDAHRGQLSLDPRCENTRFIIQLPKGTA